MKNGKRGITLIALVITIIVSLIIAGVSISLIIGENGVLNKAENASSTHNVAAAKEQANMKAAGYMSEYMQKRYVDNDLSVGSMTVGEYLLAQMNGQEDGNYRYSVSGNKITVTSKTTGEILATGTIGKNGGIAWDDSVASGGNAGTNTEHELEPLVGKVNVGDYIKYNPEYKVTDTSKLSYTSPVGELKVKNSSGNYVVNETGNNTREYNGAYDLITEEGEISFDGYTVESDVSGNGYRSQSFYADYSNNIWRVIDDGKATGYIRIIPEEPISASGSKFLMQGLRGYKNAGTELDNISKIFGYGDGAKSAKSITIEDIMEVENFDPYEGQYSTYGNSDVYRNSYNNFSKNYIDNLIFCDLTKDFLMKNYWINRKFTYPNRSIDISYSRGWYTALCYGISVMDYRENNENYTWIEILYATLGPGDEVGIYTKSYYRTPYSDGNNVLPVVTLKSDVCYIKGDGSSNSPWNFQNEPEEDYGYYEYDGD